MVEPTRSSRAASLPALDDIACRAIAAETKTRIVWDRIIHDQTEPWKWRENVRNFSLYSKQVGGFCVLSTGVVKGSVHEVASLLVSFSQEEFTQKMAALHDSDFKQATYVTDVGVEPQSGSRDYQLSVRSVTFATPGWRRREREWCFLEATQYDRAARHFEKLMTTVSARPVLGAGTTERQRKFKTSETKPLRDVIAGYLVSSIDGATSSSSKPRSSVRVHFYGEILSPPSRNLFGSFSLPSKKLETSTTNATQSRLLQLARDCDRLAQLVRRRRLGIQVLIDQRRVLPPMNALCVKCGRNLLVAKLCRICGLSVCGDCSDKYERETHVRRGPFGGNRQKVVKRLETIRVCDPCLARVEQGEYDCVNDAALAGPAVVPDPAGSSASAAVDLKQLLQEALLETQSPQWKQAVLNVIRSLLDQERSGTMNTSERPARKTTLTPDPQQLDANALLALDKLVLRNTPYADAQLAGEEGRAYPLTLDYESSFTATANEAERLQALDDLEVLTSVPCEELDIICSIAAREVGVFASIVSIVTQDAMRVVAANDPAFKVLTAERAHSFCTHAIMDDKPLIIPHPEADVRVNYTKVATALGARFYCGFPLVTDGDKVLGTLCCLDQKKHELTESQFSAMQRLAHSAAKIIQVRGRRQ